MRSTDYTICTPTGRPKRKVLAEVVRRVVEAAQPDKIILFGSAARGEMGPDSDLDLLVIKGGKYNHWRLLTDIRRQLRGAGAPVDVVVVTPEDVERYGDSPYLVIYPALREGKVVYGA
jgi:predicted nucleotidyltransferase